MGLAKDNAIRTRLNATPERKVDIVIARMDACSGISRDRNPNPWKRYSHAYFLLCERKGS